MEKYSFGMGDRFAHEAVAQLESIQEMGRLGVTIAPVWNKSNREHGFVGSHPRSVWEAAEKATLACGWSQPWYVDADHIRFDTVDPFLDCSNFFTLDVADQIGKRSESWSVERFLESHPEFSQPIALSEAGPAIEIPRELIDRTGSNYAAAAEEAGRIARKIEQQKRVGGYVVEVSMDETDAPQGPEELLIILALLADQQIPLDTIAPKFTGRFNKGVDYVGDLKQFEKELRQDVAVLRLAAARYGLPQSLKLSVHSGSDKFSLYPILRRVLAETGCGLHVKTAGTTWLEELIGLCEAGGDGLALTQEIYHQAFDHLEELCAPYATVTDIDPKKLPSPSQTSAWDGPTWASTIRHVPSHRAFHPGVRQLLHVSFKLAAKQGSRFLDLLKTHRQVIATQVRENLLERHLKPIFGGLENQHA